MLVESSGSSLYDFTFDKSVASDLKASIEQLEQYYFHLFNQIATFQEKLEPQKGHAAVDLKILVNRYLSLLGKSAPAILHFSDIAQHLLLALETVDEGGSEFTKPTSRTEWQYSFSEENLENTIEVYDASLRLAADQFQGNLGNIDELFSTFDKVINQVEDTTKIPWADFNMVWGESKYKCKSIIEELRSQAQHLITQTKLYLDEMARVDHMAADQMVQV